MTVLREFDERVLKRIAAESDSKSVKESVAYLRRARFNNPRAFMCEIIDDCCFWAGSMSKTHLRLLDIAVSKDHQGEGYGRICIFRMTSICKQHGVNKITLRVDKSEGAVKFYKRFGGTIIADKQKDWEVEIPV